uniref:Serpentine receptor class gamma n=1 Tax=Bursaphelenchus xylophilus TaxID=6326 RepID=A0A1I7RYR6_BURXY
MLPLWVYVIYYVYGIPLILLYALIIFVLIRKRRLFASVFYKFITIFGVQDICYYLVLQEARRYMNGDALKSSFHGMMPSPSWLYILQIYLKVALELNSVLGTIILAAIRVSTMLYPVEHSRVWRKTIPYVILLNILLPILPYGYVFLNSAILFCAEEDGQLYGCILSYDQSYLMLPKINRYAYTIIPTISAILNLIALVLLYRRKKSLESHRTWRHEINLTVTSFLIFMAHVTYGALNIIVYTYYSNGNLKMTSIFAGIVFPFIFDVCLLTNVCSLLTSSKLLRQEIYLKVALELNSVLGTIILAAIRVSTMLYPVEHERVWRKAIPYVILLNILLPILPYGYVFLNSALLYCAEEDGQLYGCILSYDHSYLMFEGISISKINRYAYTIIPTTSAILNLIALVLLYRRKKSLKTHRTWRHEINLTVTSLLIFVAHVSYGALNLSLSKSTKYVYTILPTISAALNLVALALLYSRKKSLKTHRTWRQEINLSMSSLLIFGAHVSYGILNVSEMKMTTILCGVLSPLMFDVTLLTNVFSLMTSSKQLRLEIYRILIGSWRPQKTRITKSWDIVYYFVAQYHLRCPLNEFMLTYWFVGLRIHSPRLHAVAIFLRGVAEFNGAFAIVLLALNRITSILYPVHHERAWNRALPYILFLNIALPTCCYGFTLLNRAVLLCDIERGEVFGCYVSYDHSFTLNGFFSITSVSKYAYTIMPSISAVLNAVALGLLYSRKKSLKAHRTWRQEINLTVSSFIMFGAHFGYGILNMMIVSYMNIHTNYMPAILSGVALPLLLDLAILTNVTSLLFSSKPLRRQVYRILGSETSGKAATSMFRKTSSKDTVVFTTQVKYYNR